MEKVTPQDVLAVSQRKLDPADLQMLVVGNQADFDTSLSALGPVKAVDISIPQAAAAAFSATDQELKEGEEWLRKSAKACGGADAFGKVSAIRTEGTVALKTPQGEMNLQTSTIEILPEKMAQTIKTPMGEQTIVVTDGSGWVTAMGKSQALPASQVEDATKSLRRELVWLLGQARQPAFKVAAHGREDFEGEPALRLDVFVADGNQFTLYLDPDSALPRGMRYSGSTMAGPGEITESYSDYREYGGLKLPARTVQKSGPMETTSETTSVEVNGKVDPEVFKKPSGI